MNEGVLQEIVNIWELLPPEEGSIDIYYGRIGGGKTSAGTRNIIAALNSGQIVYSNWKIKWDGYDERQNWWCLVLGILGLKKHFYYFPKENFHFWNFIKQELDGKPCPEFIDVLSRLTDCQVHLDEGHIPFDSYEAAKMSERKRSAVFGTRHFDRQLIIYTQRANSIHINLRQNANRFYKCEVNFDWTLPFFKKRFIHFLITEFQDTDSSGSVKEDHVFNLKTGEETEEYKFAVNQMSYWGSKKHFALFDSKYLRAGAPHSQPNYAKIYWLTWKEKYANLFSRKKTLDKTDEKI